MDFNITLDAAKKHASIYNETVYMWQECGEWRYGSGGVAQGEPFLSVDYKGNVNIKVLQ